MKAQKFVNIEVRGESNIGVIDLGILDSDFHLENLIKERIEAKLVKALNAHFDCDTEIRLIDVYSTLTPISVRATVVVKQDGAHHTENVILDETYLY